MGPPPAHGGGRRDPIPRRGVGDRRAGQTTAGGRRLARRRRSPAPSRLRPATLGSPRPLSAKLGYEWEREVSTMRVREWACGPTAARQATPPLPELPPRTSRHPGAPGLPALGQSCAASPPARGAWSPGVLSLPRPRLRPKGPPGRRGDGGDPGPVARSPCPTPPPRSPVQHFADPLAHASPRGGGQAAAAAAALGRQVLDGGHHMVRRGWRRRLQLLLRRLGGDHRGGGGGAAAIRTQPGASRAGSGPGNAQRSRPGGRGPGKRRCLRGGEAGRHPRLRPPPPSPPLTPLPSRCAQPRAAAAAACPGSSRAASPSPGTPREVAAKGVARGRGAAGRLRRPPRREGMGVRVSLLSRAQVFSGLAAAVVLAPPPPVPRALGELPSVSL